MRGIHWWPVNSLHKRSATRKMFPFDDVIMISLYCMVFQSVINQVSLNPVGRLSISKWESKPDTDYTIKFHISISSFTFIDFRSNRWTTFYRDLNGSSRVTAGRHFSHVTSIVIPKTLIEERIIDNFDIYSSCNTTTRFGYQKTVISPLSLDMGV